MKAFRQIVMLGVILGFFYTSVHHLVVLDHDHHQEQEDCITCLISESVVWVFSNNQQFNHGTLVIWLGIIGITIGPIGTGPRIHARPPPW